MTKFSEKCPLVRDILAQQRGKFTSKVHADFPKIFAQKLEYLAALWSDLDEKLSSMRSPGKFCSSRTAGTKVGKIDKIFRKVPSGERYLNLARTDGDCFLCRRATLYWHNSGANSLQKCMRIFRKFLHKNLNISGPCGQILMKSCPAGAKTMSIVILKARGPGKFCSRRWNGVKVGKIGPNFWKSALW